MIESWIYGQECELMFPYRPFLYYSELLFWFHTDYLFGFANQLHTT